LVCRGHDLSKLLNASHVEKFFYIHAKNKFEEEEAKRFGGG